MDADNRVRIEFRLPTYWCAANFSFLMADDMRRAVGELDWVAGVSVVLGEHMYADQINAGLAGACRSRRPSVRRPTVAWMICARHSWSRHFSAARWRC